MLKLTVFLLTLFSSGIAIADSTITIPLYILCEQTDNKINGWTDYYMFRFEKKDATLPYAARGSFKHYTSTDASPQNPSIKANFSQGIASVSIGEGEELFFVDAVGYWKQEDSSTPYENDLPNLIAGVTINLDGTPSEVDPMVRDPIFRNNGRFHASCKSVDKSAADAFTFAVP